MDSSIMPSGAAQIAGRAHSARKTFLDGTHRARLPAETLADYSRHMPLMGITRLANVTGLDRIGLPVCVATRPNARALATAQGKGRTMVAAKASALMEAIEGWHGERISGPVTIAAYRELAGDGRAVDPALLGLRPDASYSPDRPIAWLAGWDLMQDRSVLIPFDTVSTNFVERPDERPAFLKTTNGLASGNNLLEAIVHALLEIVERDANTLWDVRSPAERSARLIDPATVSDPDLAELFVTLADKGVAFAIEDRTTDVDIPVYGCTLVDDPGAAQWRGVPRASGFGAHLQDTIALSRAVHEAVQSRVTLVSGSRDDVFRSDYADAAASADDSQWVAEAARASAPFGTRSVPAADRFEDDLKFILGRLRSVGVGNAVVVDLTREEIGIAVVKIVVTGLEPVRTAVWQPGPRARRVMAGTSS